MNFETILNKQKNFFQSNQTKNVRYRKMYLEKLKEVLNKNSKKIYEAVYADFGKSEFETYSTEISFIFKEIDYFLKNLNALTRPKKVPTNLVNQLGNSKIVPEPYGNSLIIGAWNYPVQLSLIPAVCALASGNTVILKPSEIAAHTANVLEELINTNFPEEYFHVAKGGIEETTEILQLRFDKIFFTGSTNVGKIVYKAAAEHLTPVTLELGGKSPAIVTATANFEVAAKRIVWGKFLNAGQTCIAPDYVYVDEKFKDSLLDSLKSYIQKFQYERDSENYTRIINRKNFERLKNLIPEEKIYFGGNSSAEHLYLQPTILQDVTWDDAVMKAEIFGPILPVLTYKNFGEALQKITENEKPLAAYLFTSNEDEKKWFVNKLSFGGGCINDTLMHIGNPNLPFGGVGHSGMGNYHGKFGFDAFSHHKAVLERTTRGEPDLKYPPYTENKKNWLKKLL